MDFAQASTPTQTSDSRWLITADDSWSQGRAMFGGLVGANLINALLPLAAPGHKLRVISIALEKPVPPEGSTIETHIDRTGRSTTFASATITAAGELCARATAVFGADRASSLHVPATPPRLAVPIADANALPLIDGITPNFLQHIDMRFVTDYPYTGSSDPHVAGYLRFNDDASGPAALVAAMDAFPPAVLPMANGPISSSTIQWTAHFIDPELKAGRDWFEFTYQTVHSGHGYAISAGTLVRDDRVVGWTEQVGAFFE